MLFFLTLKQSACSATLLFMYLLRCLKTLLWHDWVMRQLRKILHRGQKCKALGRQHPEMDSWSQHEMKTDNDMARLGLQQRVQPVLENWMQGRVRKLEEIRAWSPAWHVQQNHVRRTCCPYITGLGNTRKIDILRSLLWGNKLEFKRQDGKCRQKERKSGLHSTIL